MSQLLFREFRREFVGTCLRNSFNSGSCPKAESDMTEFGDFGRFMKSCADKSGYTIKSEAMSKSLSLGMNRDQFMDLYAKSSDKAVLRFFFSSPKLAFEYCSAHYDNVLGEGAFITYFKDHMYDDECLFGPYSLADCCCNSNIVSAMLTDFTVVDEPELFWVELNTTINYMKTTGKREVFTNALNVLKRLAFNWAALKVASELNDSEFQSTPMKPSEDISEVINVYAGNYNLVPSDYPEAKDHAIGLVANGKAYSELDEHAKLRVSNYLINNRGVFNRAIADAGKVITDTIKKEDIDPRTILGGEVTNARLNAAVDAIKSDYRKYESEPMKTKITWIIDRFIPMANRMATIAQLELGSDAKQFFNSGVQMFGGLPVVNNIYEDTYEAKPVTIPTPIHGGEITTESFVKKYEAAQRQFNEAYVKIYRDLIQCLDQVQIKDIFKHNLSKLYPICRAFNDVAIKDARTTIYLSGLYGKSNRNGVYREYVNELINMLNKSGVTVFASCIDCLKRLDALLKASQERATKLKQDFIHSPKQPSDELLIAGKSIKIPCDLTQTDFRAFDEAINRLLYQLRNIGAADSLVNIEEDLKRYLEKSSDRLAVIEERHQMDIQQIQHDAQNMDSVSARSTYMSIMKSISDKYYGIMKYFNSLDNEETKHRAQIAKMKAPSKEMINKIETSYMLFNKRKMSPSFESMFKKLDNLIGTNDIFGAVSQLKAIIKQSGYVEFLAGIYKTFGIFSKDFNWPVFNDNLIDFMILGYINIARVYKGKDKTSNTEVCGTLQMLEHKYNQTDTIATNTTNVNDITWKLDPTGKKIKDGAGTTMVKELDPAYINNPRFGLMLNAKRHNELSVHILKSLYMPILELIDRYWSLKYNGNLDLPINIDTMMRGGSVFDMKLFHDVKNTQIIDEAVPLYVCGINICKHYIGTMTKTDDMISGRMRISPLSNLYPVAEIFKSGIEVKNMTREQLNTCISVFNDIWNATNGDPQTRLNNAIDMMLNELNAVIFMSNGLETSLIENGYKGQNAMLRTSIDSISWIVEKISTIQKEAMMSTYSKNNAEDLQLGFERLMKRYYQEVKAASADMKANKLYEILTKNEGIRSIDEYYKFMDLVMAPMKLCLDSYRQLLNTVDSEVYVPLFTEAKVTCSATATPKEIAKARAIEFNNAVMEFAKSGKLDLKKFKSAGANSTTYTYKWKPFDASHLSTLASCGIVGRSEKEIYRIIYDDMFNDIEQILRLFMSYPGLPDRIMKSIDSLITNGLTDVKNRMNEHLENVSGTEFTSTGFTSPFNQYGNIPTFTDDKNTVPAITIIDAVNAADAVEKTIYNIATEHMKNPIVEPLNYNGTKIDKSAINDAWVGIFTTNVLTDSTIPKAQSYTLSADDVKRIKNAWFVVIIDGSAGVLPAAVVENNKLDKTAHDPNLFDARGKENSNSLITYGMPNDKVRNGYLDYCIYMIAKCHPQWQIPYKLVQMIRLDPLLGQLAKPMLCQPGKLFGYSHNRIGDKILNVYTQNIMQRSSVESNQAITDYVAYGQQVINKIVSILPYLIHECIMGKRTIRSDANYDGINVHEELDAIISLMTRFYNDISPFVSPIKFLQTGTNADHPIGQLLTVASKPISDLDFTQLEWANKYKFNDIPGIKYPEFNNVDRFSWIKTYAEDIFRNPTFKNNFDVIVGNMGRHAWNMVLTHRKTTPIKSFLDIAAFVKGIIARALMDDPDMANINDIINKHVNSTSKDIIKGGWDKDTNVSNEWANYTIKDQNKLDKMQVRTVQLLTDKQNDANLKNYASILVDYYNVPGIDTISIDEDAYKIAFGRDPGTFKDVELDIKTLFGNDDNLDIVPAAPTIKPINDIVINDANGTVDDAYRLFRYLASNRGAINEAAKNVNEAAKKVNEAAKKVNAAAKKVNAAATKVKEFESQRQEVLKCSEGFIKQLFNSSLDIETIGTSFVKYSQEPVGSYADLKGAFQTLLDKAISSKLKEINNPATFKSVLSEISDKLSIISKEISNNSTGNTILTSVFATAATAANSATEAATAANSATDGTQVRDAIKKLKPDVFANSSFPGSMFDSLDITSNIKATSDISSKASLTTGTDILTDLNNNIKNYNTEYNELQTKWKELENACKKSQPNTNYHARSSNKTQIIEQVISIFNQPEKHVGNNHGLIYGGYTFNNSSDTRPLSALSQMYGNTVESPFTTYFSGATLSSASTIYSAVLTYFHKSNIQVSSLIQNICYGNILMNSTLYDNVTAKFHEIATTIKNDSKLSDDTKKMVEFVIAAFEAGPPEKSIVNGDDIEKSLKNKIAKDYGTGTYPGANDPVTINPSFMTQFIRFLDAYKNTRIVLVSPIRTEVARLDYINTYINAVIRMLHLTSAYDMETETDLPLFPRDSIDPFNLP